MREKLARAGRQTLKLVAFAFGAQMAFAGTSC